MANNHGVWSEKPLLLRDGETGHSFDSFRRGTAILSWYDHTRYGYFDAFAVVPAPIGSVRYQFTLVGISDSADDMIEGLFDIRRNGVVVVRGGVGKLYGLNLPVGEYFKLYVGDSHGYAEKWHYGAYITNRLDV